MTLDKSFVVSLEDSLWEASETKSECIFGYRGVTGCPGIPRREERRDSNRGG